MTLHQFLRIPAKFPLLIFLISAGFGVWAAYEPASARAKFVLIALAVVLYIILAVWPADQMVWAARAITGLAAAIALYFLWTADWNQSPADLGIINRLGLAWMRLQPPLPNTLPLFHPNFAGGLIAALLPISLITLWADWQNKHRGWRVVGLLAVGLSAIGLLMSSSRAAWLALLIGLGMWRWWIDSKVVGERLRARREVVFALPVILVLIVTVSLAWLQFGSLINLANAVPGAASAGSRAEIALNSLHLSQGFLFSGGGLAAFPGLYARYIRVIPVYEFGYAHNLYLDLLVEQGIFGLAAFLWISVGSIVLLWNAIRRGSTLAAPVMAGLTVMLLHGFFDDAFYGMGGTCLVFILPGMAAAFGVQKAHASKKPPFDVTALLLPAFISGSLLVLIGLLPAARASLYTNLGAVSMAKLQLTGWPNVDWSNPNFVSRVRPAQTQFNYALEQDPDHVPALYGLGMIALEMRDFTTAEAFLAKAHALSPRHIGVRKNLGYAQLWNGNIEAAAEYFADLPGIRQELDYYIWWWATQARDDLSAYATQLIEWQQGNSSNEQ